MSALQRWADGCEISVMVEQMTYKSSGISTKSEQSKRIVSYQRKKIECETESEK